MFTKKHLILISFLLASFLISFFVLVMFQKKNVKIDAFPKKAKYRIDGVEGSIPATLKLRPGKHQIELSADDFKILKSSINVPYLKKEISLSYTLKPIPGRVNPRAGDIDEKAAGEQIKNNQNKFPFLSLLPYQGKTFYIDRPYDDGRISVYIFRDNELQAKKDALQWITDHGGNIAAIQILWKYSAAQ